MKRVLEFLNSHKYFVGLFALIGFSIVLSTSYSNYFVESKNHRVAEMYIGSLKYSIKIDNNETNTLTVEPGETIIDIKVNNLNPVDTYYKLLYLNNSNLKVEYFESAKELDDSNNITKTYDKPNSSIVSENFNNIKLKITNSSTSSQSLSLSVKGGYINNTLNDISVPSGYSEILTLNNSTNTYFCKTNDTLTQGLEYVNGGYTYGYKKEGKYVSSGINWQNISNNGWGVQLTDKTSTSPVTSKLCTYINNKPVVSMSAMFSASQATSLDLSNFDTSNVTNMNYMFTGSEATTLDLSNLNTSNVTNMSGMFSNSQATAVDVSNLNTSNVTNMSQMFWNSAATTLDLSNFDTSNVTNMDSMFSDCQATAIDLSSFDTHNVTDMSYMFRSSQATTLDLSNFNTSKVTSMKNMFQGCQTKTLDLSNFDTSNVTDMSGMFNLSQAAAVDISNFNTRNVTDMSYMFRGSKSTLDLSNFNTSNVTDMQGMFYNYSGTLLDVSNFNTSNVTNMSYMFQSCKATTLDLSNFNTSNVINMDSMFAYNKATTIDLSSFDMSNVNNINSMFYYSSNLKTIYASSKFSIKDVVNSSGMFGLCTNLVGGAGTKFNSSYVDKTYARIDTASTPGYFTDVSQKPTQFEQDSWMTIIANVKAGNISKYNVGDTKTIDMGTYGTHTLRIANTSTPSECSTSGFSQTACGFVLEFADIITTHNMNDTSIGGGDATNMRTFVNNDIYNLLPTDLKNEIIDTSVVSSHGSSDSSNFTSTDKLYLLAPKEIYSDFNYTSDTAKDLTRQLDYYKNEGVTMSSYSKAIKMYNSVATI